MVKEGGGGGRKRIREKELPSLYTQATKRTQHVAPNNVAINDELACYDRLAGTLGKFNVTAKLDLHLKQI